MSTQLILTEKSSVGFAVFLGPELHPCPINRGREMSDYFLENFSIYLLAEKVNNKFKDFGDQPKVVIGALVIYLIADIVLRVSVKYLDNSHALNRVVGNMFIIIDCLFCDK